MVSSADDETLKSSNKAVEITLSKSKSKPVGKLMSNWIALTISLLERFKAIVAFCSFSTIWSTILK